jgi:hypothetical protein
VGERNGDGPGQNQESRDMNLSQSPDIFIILPSGTTSCLGEPGLRSSQAQKLSLVSDVVQGFISVRRFENQRNAGAR